MTRAVWIDGTRVSLPTSALVGQGGEAEVYDLGDGRVVKWWKPPEHPDFAGIADAQAAVAKRLAEQPAKLRALPAGLPGAVVAPSGFALAAKRSTEVVGYVMPKVAGTALHAYGEPRWRRDHPIDSNDVVTALRALHDAIAALHRANVVIGDCNDLNVIVDGPRVHLIDVDSYQYGGFTCPMFSERFVDPRLCTTTALVPIQPHDPASDWFAFAAMALRSLVYVGPWGGVAKQCLLPARPLRRLSVLGPDIVYPRAARPLAILPDELVDAFRRIFESDDRTPLCLDNLRFRRCPTCGDEHARLRCPSCATAVAVPAAIVHGKLRVHTIHNVELSTYEVGRTTPIWIDAGALWRHGRLGNDRLGGVLAGQTRAWVGPKLGVGFYRAGGFATGFVFRPDRGALDDRVALPPIRGQLVDAHATIGDDRAWLWLSCANAGRLTTTVVVIAADATVLATQTIDASWLAGVAGACTAGPHLFVPTDDGIARIEIIQGTVAHTRTFAETASLVSSADRLAIAAGGIDVVRQRDAIHMQLG